MTSARSLGNPPPNNSTRPTGHYCPNPRCGQRHQSELELQCQSCQTDLLLDDRYDLLSPLRALNDFRQPEVFLAEDEDGLKVIKLLTSKLSHFRQALDREARALAALNHPGIPRFHPGDYFPFTLGNGQRLHCLVMEHIEGETLGAHVQRRGCVGLEEVVHWLAQLVDILQHLHDRGFVHGDVKPDNVILRPDGRLVLVDFGTAVETGTVRGRSEGSEGYAPPEQLNDPTHQAQPRDDGFALARTMLHLLSGQHPVDWMVAEGSPLAMQRWASRQLPVFLGRWFGRLMAPEVADRPLNWRDPQMDMILTIARKLPPHSSGVLRLLAA